MAKNAVIISSGQILEDYPKEAIDPSILDDIYAIIKPYKKHSSNEAFRIIILFECYLQITNQIINSTTVTKKTFINICIGFIGALNTKSFIDLTHMRRYAYTKSFLNILQQLQNKYSFRMDLAIPISSIGITKEIQNCVSEFARLALVEEKVWLWRGWKSVNRKGRVTWFPLYPIYKRLGRDFCQKFHDVCDDYFRGRKADKIDCLKSFTLYINEYPGFISTANFADGQFLSVFWRNFFAYYIQTGHKSGVSVVTLINQWRGGFVSFVENYLVNSGLFSKTLGMLPSPESGKRGSRTHITITDNGLEVKTKLITDIPLQLTDDKALKLLFVDIQNDHDLFLNWAKWGIKDIWDRYVRRRKLSRKGEVRHFLGKESKIKNNPNGPNLEWLTDRKNLDYLKNVTATFESLGYMTRHDVPVHLIYPRPLDLTAYELGIPVSGSLLPHCTALTAMHPEITPSFLENLQIFDKNEKVSGFVCTDAGTYLVGFKYRCGAAMAEQKILLNKNSRKIVKQIIMLTMPLRKYLKSRNDDNYRYLLLTAKRGFSYPLRVKKLATDTSSPDRVEELAQSLGATTTLSLEVRRHYAKRFSLPAMRSSAAVLVYINSGSVEKMANALGHSQYDHRLLSRYLPEPLLQFFQERWIRIFQEAMIVEALKDSNYLLEASSFTTIDELDEFIRNHAFKEVPKYLDDPYIKPDMDTDELNDSLTQIIFGVNTGILTILLSLEMAVSLAVANVNAKARYYARVTNKLVSYIEAKENNRIDLQSYLSRAKAKADPSLVEALIYD